MRMGELRGATKRSEMTSRLAFRPGLVTWCRSRASALGLLLVNCLAQEEYRPSPAAGGAAGSNSAGFGGISLITTAAAGAGGGAGAQHAGVGCRSSEECAPPSPYCSTSLGRCVECLSPANCRGSGRGYCELSSNTCVYCLTDSHCTQAAPYCAIGIGHCVECLSSTNCGGAGLLCDRDNYRCTSACEKHADCASSPGTPFCDPDRNLCVACVSDDGCASPSPRCDPKQHVCVACATDGDCQPGVSCVAGACANPR